MGFSAKAAFIFGYKFTEEEIEKLKIKVFPEDETRKEKFFEDYCVGPTPDHDFFIGIIIEEAYSQQEVTAKDLKLKPNQLNELKYIMMHTHITEVPKFYLILSV